MLAKYLKEIRASKKIASAQALSHLGSGWTQGDDGSLQKEFLFDDHTQASNFMTRYAMYCQKVNLSPNWSNVYNRVNVKLVNDEFGGVTTKEVSAGQYLDVVEKARLHQDIDEDLSFQ